MISSWKAASRGISSASRAGMTPSFRVLAWTSNRVRTRDSSRPERSSAARVLSKLAGPGSARIRPICSRWAAMAASKAAGNAAGSTWSQGGTPPKGPVQGAVMRGEREARVTGGSRLAKTGTSGLHLNGPGEGAEPAAAGRPTPIA